MNASSGNAIVDETSSINLEGNVIPRSWFITLKKESGKPHTNAILILADIVFWYRAKVIYHPNEDKVVGYKKRFKHDLLQRSYKQIEEAFGFSKKQSKDALVFLESKGVIKRHFRTIFVDGIKLSNVMYIELIPSVLRTITNIGMDNGHSCVPEGAEGYGHSDTDGTDLNVQTNTKITNTKITNTKNNIYIVENDEKNDKSSAIRQEIVSYLNEKTGSRYKPNTSKTVTLINARLNEGFTLDDFKQVIDVKTAQWVNDNRFSKFLRPETLFGNKFEGYLNENSNRMRLSNGQVIQYEISKEVEIDDLPF